MALWEQEDYTLFKYDSSFADKYKKHSLLDMLSEIDDALDTFEEHPNQLNFLNIYCLIEIFKTKIKGLPLDKKGLTKEAYIKMSAELRTVSKCLRYGYKIWDFDSRITFLSKAITESYNTLK